AVRSGQKRASLTENVLVGASSPPRTSVRNYQDTSHALTHANACGPRRAIPIQSPTALGQTPEPVGHPELHSNVVGPPPSGAATISPQGHNTRPFPDKPGLSTRSRDRQIYTRASSTSGQAHQTARHLLNSHAAAASVRSPGRRASPIAVPNNRASAPCT